MLVLLLQPETGDDLQWEKAGLLEVADVVVVHKADLPGADRVEAQVLAGLTLSSRPPPAVLRTSARSGVGVAELWRLVASLPLRRGERGADELFRLLLDRLAARRAAVGVRVEAITSRWRSGATTTEAGVVGTTAKPGQSVSVRRYFRGDASTCA